MGKYKRFKHALAQYFSFSFFIIAGSLFFGGIILVALEGMIDIPSPNLPEKAKLALGLVPFLITFIYRVRKGHSESVEEEIAFSILSIILVAAIPLLLYLSMIALLLSGT